MIRDNRAQTRAELARLSGLSRSTISQRLEPLLAEGLVVAGGDLESMGGRPPGSLIFNPKAGLILVADCGASQTRTGLADLSGEMIVEELTEIAIASGPQEFLGWLEATLDGHLEAAGVDENLLCGVGIGIPGPVDHGSGTPVSPPIMPGWDGVPVAGRLSETYGVPTLIDNDVNIMALGEHRRSQREVRNMIFVKVGTGIGAGLILDGEIHRGSHGAAGDIGHIHVVGHDTTPCKCGNLGCLEALAGAQALAERLQPREAAWASVEELIFNAQEGRPEALAAVRDAGRKIGGVLAAVVNVTDPEVVVVGGRMAAAEQPLIAGIREVVYRQSLPLATHDLRIVRSSLEGREGIVGAARMVTDWILSQDGWPEPSLRPDESYSHQLPS